MIDPDLICAASAAARAICVAVEPPCTVIAGAAVAPSAAGEAPLAGASRFMCCDLVAKAIVNFVQLRNSRLTCAASDSRTCSRGDAGMPVISCDVWLDEDRTKFRIHPRSIHGLGGASRLKLPCCEGSKVAGHWVTRLTGAK